MNLRGLVRWVLLLLSFYTILSSLKKKTGPATPLNIREFLSYIITLAKVNVLCFLIIFWFAWLFHVAEFYYIPTDIGLKELICFQGYSFLWRSQHTSFKWGLWSSRGSCISGKGAIFFIDFWQSFKVLLLDTFCSVQKITNEIDSDRLPLCSVIYIQLYLWDQFLKRSWYVPFILKPMIWVRTLYWNPYWLLRQHDRYI